jgi:hypothetical protein
MDSPTMPDWLKRNAVLALGISLPLLLVVAMLILHGLARLGQEPPGQPVVYASFDHYSPELYFEFQIDSEGHLRVRARKPEKAPYGRTTPTRTNIAVFDAVSGRQDVYTLSTPPELTEGEEAPFELPSELASLRLSGSTLSPDGYRFEASHGGSGGLFPSLFGYDRRRDTRLVKDSAVYDIPEIEGYHGTKRFIGWVIDER